MLWKSWNMCTHLIPRHFSQNLTLQMVGLGHGQLLSDGKLCLSDARELRILP
jgi:hypothetical protein